MCNFKIVVLCSVCAVSYSFCLYGRLWFWLIPGVRLYAEFYFGFLGGCPSFLGLSFGWSLIALLGFFMWLTLLGLWRLVIMFVLGCWVVSSVFLCFGCASGLLSYFDGVICWFVLSQDLPCHGLYPVCVVQVVDQCLVLVGVYRFGFLGFCGVVVWVIVGSVMDAAMLAKASINLFWDLGIYFLNLIYLYFCKYHFLFLQNIVFAGIRLGLNANFRSRGFWKLFAVFWVLSPFWVLALAHRRMYLGSVYFFSSRVPDFIGFGFFFTFLCICYFLVL